MRVQVDFGLCESNGFCMAVAPELFELGDDDTLTVLDPEVSPENLALVREAVRRCPRQAITIVD
jgi:ferredoxin